MNTGSTTPTLKYYRLKTGMTQATVAGIVGISVSHYCNIENRNRGINYSLAKRLSACLNITIDKVYKSSGY